MSFGPLLALATAGIVVVAAMAFWAMLQNWMAEVIHRARVQLGPLAHTLQSALVILDRLMVNGQRLVIATGRVLFNDAEAGRTLTSEEMRQIDPRALPADVLKRLESGQSVSYEISDSSGAS
jgi:hypothetical protein